MAQVSVVIPVYNVEQYLDRCVQSVLNQTLKDIEIILVDDGSPDNCPQMCDDYARRYDNIKVVHKANAGLGMACNSGMDVATGKYIAFLDSDDWVDPDMYETMLRDAEANNAQMVFTGLKRVNAGGIEAGRLPHKAEYICYRFQNVQKLLADMIASDVMVRCERTIQVSAKVVLYDLEFLREHKIRFVSERQFLSEDLLFNISALVESNCVVVNPAYYYNYFINPDSITANIKDGHVSKLLKTIEAMQNTISKRIFAIERYDLSHRINRFIIGELRSYSRQILRSTLPWRKKKVLLQECLNECSIKDLRNNYPMSEMPVAHRLAFFLFINEQYRLLDILYRIK